MSKRIARYTEDRFEFGFNRPEPIPEQIQVIYEKDVPYAVDFVCPCGCGKSLFIPVTTPDRPTSNRITWAFSRGPNGITLSPSILWTGDCKSHFHITDGAVVWA